MRRIMTYPSISPERWRQFLSACHRFGQLDNALNVEHPDPALKQEFDDLESVRNELVIEAYRAADPERIHRPHIQITPALSADDTAQIDDQVADVLTTIICREVELEYGTYVDPEHLMMDEIRRQFFHDLASLGIRLTYDAVLEGTASEPL